MDNKVIRDSKVFIFKIKDRIFKIPLSLSAIREISHERKNIERVKKDKYFSHYLLDYQYFLGIQSTPYLTLFDRHPNSASLIKNYFKLAFQNESYWKQISLQQTINCHYYLKFISQYLNNDYNFWIRYLDNTTILQSSVHGDFYPENILVKNNKLYFIDWIRYSSTSSRYFDLIDFHIFSGKNKEQSWMEFWLQEYNSKKSEIQDIKIKIEYLFAYGIWKVSEELKTLYLRKDLNKYKVKKYINFIKTLADLIKEGESQNAKNK